MIKLLGFYKYCPVHIVRVGAFTGGIPLPERFKYPEEGQVVEFFLLVGSPSKPVNLPELEIGCIKFGSPKVTL